MADTLPSPELWDGVWRRSGSGGAFHQPFLSAISQVMEVSGARILEVGCGSAADSAELARRGARVWALDFSWQALQRVRAGMAEEQALLSLVNGDTFCLPYPEATFDLVFSQGLLEHFVDPLPALCEQTRVLRAGGWLCVDVPQTLSPVTLRKRWHVWRGTWFAGWETSFTLGELEGLLRGQGLEPVTSYGHIYPELGNALRNFHTLDERRALPFWFGPATKRRVEGVWRWLESRRWYYRFMACVGVVARKVDA